MQVGSKCSRFVLFGSCQLEQNSYIQINIDIINDDDNDEITFVRQYGPIDI